MQKIKFDPHFQRKGYMTKVQWVSGHILQLIKV